MFRRNRSASASASRTRRNVPAAPASSAASLAASQAFLASRPSSVNLSSAAAAAALRSMTPTPTPVSQVMTKRMLQKHNSVSSNGSGRPGGLQRQGSSGSMTERTFRSPSPNRQGSQTAEQRPAPPVPQIPQPYSEVPPLPVRSHRRAISTEPPPRVISPPPRVVSPPPRVVSPPPRVVSPPPRVVSPPPRVVSPPPRVISPPPRVISPPPREPAGRGVSVGHGPGPSSPIPPQIRSSSLQNMSELERSDSRESYNFSYPRGVRPQSPDSPRADLSPVVAEQVRHDMTQISTQPVKKKKKKVATAATQGSHFQSGGMGGSPNVTPLAPGSKTVASTGESPVAKKKKAAALTGQSTHFPNQAPQQRPLSPNWSSDSDTTPEKTRERRTQRASGNLIKQPSIVREDWEGEQEGVSGSRLAQTSSPLGSPVEIPKSKKRATAVNEPRKIDDGATSPVPNGQLGAKVESANGAVVGHSKAGSNLVGTNITPFESATPTTSAPKSGNMRPKSTSQLAIVQKEETTSRTVSLSPSRSTRFSDRLASDLASGKKHEPLPRSVSPAKSAMRKHHSPAPSNASATSPTDGNFPSRLRNSSQAPSDVSDSNSVMSADGYAPGLKKKKSARVSFDAQADIVATTPVLDTIPAEDDMEDVMKPRPALPAFGSVRDKDRNKDMLREKTSPARAAAPATVLPSTYLPSTTSSTSSQASTATNPPTINTSTSSDQGIGAIFAAHSAKSAAEAETQRTTTSEPLPPEVTSVEGTGYESSDNSDNEEGHLKHAVAKSDRPVTEAGSIGTVAAENVPTIAVQPATPAIDRPGSRDEWLVSVPGGFPSTGDQTSNTNSQISKEVADGNALTSSSTGLGVATPPSLSDALRQAGGERKDNDSSDGDSVYSDAAQDISDGEGFGSINAIVTSPLVTSPAKNVTTPPESPLADRPNGRTRTASWDHTQAHWSGLRQSIHAQPVATTVEKRGSQPPAKQTIETKAKPKVTPDATGPRPAPQKIVEAPLPGKPPTVPVAKLSEKAAAGQAALMQSKWASNEALSAGRTAARAGNAPKQAAPRPTPAQPAQGPKPKVALQKKRIPPGVAATGVPAAPAATALGAAFQARPKPGQRTFSNDSDSESSFRKQRKARRAEGQYSMKRSMRSGAGSTDAAPRSPVTSRPSSPFMQKTMRSSMRNSNDPGAYSLRTQSQPQPESQKRSSSLFARSRKALSPTRSPKLLPVKLGSRFGDSDDEGVLAPKAFQSRFGDSSDEEGDNFKYRPVRGIPRKTDEGDSTELEDSSDEKNKARVRSHPPPRIITNVKDMHGMPDLNSPPLSPTTAKKRGLFSLFRSKKDNDVSSESRPGVGSPNARDTILERSKRDKLQNDKKKASRLGFDTVGERDAMIAQARARLEAGNQPAALNAASGKQQRRPHSQRIQSDSWPLPPKLPDGLRDRPSTSDGVGLGMEKARSDTNGRPGLAARHSTYDPHQAGEANPAYGRSGKKKRFTKLRRAFGLVD